MVLLPAVVYLFTGWVARRDRIITILDAAALKEYYGKYFPSIEVDSDTDEQLCRRFSKHYGQRYGRRTFVIPLLLLGAIAGIGAIGTAESVIVWRGLSTGKAFPEMAVSALLGAFMWVVADQLGRFSSRDFTSTDVSNCVYRILIAVPFGYSLQTFASKEFGIPLAFLLGAFPTGTLFTIARRLVGQKLGLGEEASGGKLQIESLQGVSRTNAERFLDAGVSTIGELAWVDPIDLSIRANRDFNYVVDCMSQALVWIYFEDKTESLSRYAVRGAQEVAFLVNDLKNTDPELQWAAQQALAGAASSLNMTPAALSYTLTQVRDDPYTQFLISVWS
jgi:hypothetical protein